MARRRTTQTTQTTDDQTTETTGAPAGTNAANADAPVPAPARRGRRPRTDTSSNASDSDTAETVADTETAPQQRRRRRRNTIDMAAEASRLIAAVLRHRGVTGASQEELRHVVVWGRGTRAESQELQRGAGQKGSGRGRRPSEEALARAQRSELNTLLLERVLLGTLGLDVQQGQLVFRRQELDGRITKG